MTTTFQLSHATDLETLVEIDHPELRTVRSLVADMIHGGEAGTFEVETGADVLADPVTEREIPGSEIAILFIPSARRAGITDNGSTRWTDASSVADAVRRYREDDLAN